MGTGGQTYVQEPKGLDDAVGKGEGSSHGTAFSDKKQVDVLDRRPRSRSGGRHFGALRRDQAQIFSGMYGWVPSTTSSPDLA
jgi:hypothetical protein